jgi:hypothetical protein
MLHVTLMGGAEVRLKEEDNIVITVMGATEILTPTIAEKIIYMRRMKKDRSKYPDNATRRTNVITLMGATVTKLPTIGKEIEELFDLRESGMMSNDELSELWCDVLEKDDFDVIENITIMGGAGDELPPDEEEMNAIDRLVMKGVISGDEAEEIKDAIKSQDFSGIKSKVIQDKIRYLLIPPPAPYKLSSTRMNPALRSHQTE